MTTHTHNTHSTNAEMNIFPQSDHVHANKQHPTHTDAHTSTPTHTHTYPNNAELSSFTQSDSATAEKVLGLILPLLLQEGISVSAAEVRVASVHQLVKLTKHAGASLAPHIPELASVLLESLSSLEPLTNTYLQVIYTHMFIHMYVHS